MDNRKPTRDNGVREWWNKHVAPLQARATLEGKEAMQGAVRRANQRGALNSSPAAKDRVMEAVRVLRDFCDGAVELVRRFRNASPERLASESVSELSRCALHSFDILKATLQREFKAVAWGTRRGFPNSSILSAADEGMQQEATVMRRELAAAIELEATAHTAPAVATVEVLLPESSGWRFWLPHGLAAAGVVLAVLTLVL
jgi:hypothetical protein